MLSPLIMRVPTLPVGSWLPRSSTSTSGVRTRRSPGITRLLAEVALQVNPADAKALGVADGESVTVTAQNGGALDAAVRVTTRVPVGMVFLPAFSATAPVTRLMVLGVAGPVAVKVQRL